MADGERAERLGEIIRRQRELSALSMRQFADLVGISNPYLSQIERGLREPSERVLEGIAKSLQLSVETLREQAGLHVDDQEETPAVVEAIRTDPKLTGRQRQAMLEVYRAFTAPATRGRAGRAAGWVVAPRLRVTLPRPPTGPSRGGAETRRAARPRRRAPSSCASG